MTTPLWIFVFILALAALLKASEMFVSNLRHLVKVMGWSSFFVGTTLMAIGTSLPELTSSLWAAWGNTTSLIASDVVGSNLFNFLVIGGLGALLYKHIELGKENFRAISGLLLGSTFLLMVTFYDGQLYWYEGILLLITYLAFTLYTAEEHRAGRLEHLKEWFSKQLIKKDIAILWGNVLVSAIVLGASSYFVVKALENIASQTGLGLSLLGASILAIGTSLPELTTSLIAFKKGDHEMGLGNLIGSNIFNATLVVGLPALFHPLTISGDILSLGIPFLLIASILMMFALIQRKISAYEGILYLILYVLFLFQLFAL